MYEIFWVVYLPYKNQPKTINARFAAPKQFVIIKGKFPSSSPYNIQTIAPVKRREYDIIEMSLALFLLKIFITCGKPAIPLRIPKVVANIDKTDIKRIEFKN